MEPIGEPHPFLRSVGVSGGAVQRRPLSWTVSAPVLYPSGGATFSVYSKFVQLVRELRLNMYSFDVGRPCVPPPPCLHLPDPGDARCVARLRRPGREHRFVSLSCDGGRELIRRCHQGPLHAGAHRWRMRRHCCRRGSIPARHSAHKNAGASARAHGQLERARTHLMRPRTLHRRRRKAS